jgi:UDP-N-acetylmuramate--alanine ligase
MAPPTAIHFLGIGGSGTSAAAQIAKHLGFNVTGCNQENTPYLDQVRASGIPVSIGHNPDHLLGSSLLVVTPAVFYQNPDHPEVTQAQTLNKLITWQEFLGKYILPNKITIAIAGTHGKSTTTALAGLLLESANLDPLVSLGATVPSWHNTARLGNGKHFVVEADEYYHNFLHYHPQIIILNNIELDHPEYFGTLDKVIDAFQHFVNQLDPSGLLIYNADSPQINRLVKPAHAIGYSLAAVTNLVQSPTQTTFTYQGQTYQLALMGKHNVANALGVIELANHLGIATEVVQSVLNSFTGIDRRLQLIGQKRSITVLDDYANHPTAFQATLAAAHQKYPTSNIWAVIEPHTYSRLRAVLPDLAPALHQANHVIFSKIYPSRETDPGDFSSATLAAAVPNSQSIPEFSHIAQYLASNTQPNDVILVMGSGDSYKLSRLIFDNL